MLHRSAAAKLREKLAGKKGKKGRKGNGGKKGVDEEEHEDDEPKPPPSKQPRVEAREKVPMHVRLCRTDSGEKSCHRRNGW